MVVVAVTVDPATFFVVTFFVVEVVLPPPLYVVSRAFFFVVAFQSYVVTVVDVFVVRGPVGLLLTVVTGPPEKHGNHAAPLMSAQISPPPGLLQKIFPAAFRLHIPVPEKQLSQLGPVVVLGTDDVGAAV